MSSVHNSAHRPDVLDKRIAERMNDRPKGVRRREWFAKVMGETLGGPAMSHRMISLASTVVNQGSPQLIIAVDAGKIKTYTAAILAELPHDQQDAAIDAGKDAINAAVRKLRPNKPRRFHGDRREALKVIEDAAGHDVIHFITNQPDDTDDTLDGTQKRMRQTFAQLIDEQPDAVAHVLWSARKEYEGHYWLFFANMVLRRLYCVEEDNGPCLSK